MKPLLLLVLLSVAFSQLSTYTIDCVTSLEGGLSFDLNCAAGDTYQLVNATAQGVGSVAKAWQQFLQYCGPTLTGDTTFSFIGDCLLSPYPGIYVDSNFDGTITFQGDGGTPSKFTYDGIGNSAFLYTAVGNTDFTQSFVLQDLIFEDVSGGTGAAFFPNTLITAESGNWTLSNVKLVDVYSSQSTIFFDGSSIPSDPPSTVSVTDFEYYFTGTFSTPDLTYYAGETSGDLFRLPNGVSAAFDKLNIHDTSLRDIVNFYGSGGAVESISVTLTNIDVTNVWTYTDAGFILGIASSATATLPVSNYDVLVDSVTITNLTFVASSSPSSIGLLGWVPDNNYVAGTFKLSNLVVDNVAIDTLGSHAIKVIGRGATDFANLTISNVAVTTATDLNGADGASSAFLYFDGTDGATVSDSSFTGNTGFIWGQIVTGELTTNSVLSNLVFDSNVGTSQKSYLSRGGALHLLGSALVEASTFTLNVAEIGGAVYIDNVDVFLDGCTFTNNTATVARNRRFTTGAGGAILKNLEGLLSVKNSAFTFNTAKYGGGALAVIQDQLLDTTTTNQNDGGDLFLDTCTFEQNSASYGGGIYWYARDFIAQNTNFTNNVATTGGAVSAADINPFVSSPILFTNARFVSNTANGGSIQGLDLLDGGAVSTQRSATFEKSLFEANNAVSGNGGAITAYKGLTTSYSKFTANTAFGVGGAIWSSPVQPQPLSLFRSDFIENTAGTDGGAVWTNNPQTTFDGASFSTNTAGQFGGAAYLATEATLVGAGFVNNTAKSGGAVYSVGDAAISQSRFDSNVATVDGGAIDCISVPLGAVDFTLNLASNFFYNNQAAGLGGHVHSTCTLADTGSTFQSAAVTGDVASVQCDGEQRVLRQCELSFTKTKFLSDSVTVSRPTATLQQYSSGLVFSQVTATTFTLWSQAESTTIDASSFEDYNLKYDDTPTTITNSNFVNGDEELLANGPFTLSGNSYQLATLTISGVTTIASSKFETSHVTSSADVSLTDVTARGGSSFDLGAAANLKRVTVDATSTTITRGTTTASDVTVGAYQQVAGSLDLEGTFTAGGAGLDVVIGVDVTGSGDFIVVDGTFKYVDGSFGGSGALIVQAGSANFQAAGGVLTRTTTVAGDLEFQGTGAVALDSTLDVTGNLLFGQDASVTAGPLGKGLLNIRGLVTFDQGNIVEVDTVSFGNAVWPIIDKDTYASVTFKKSFDWQSNATWTGHDARNFQYYYQDFGNGTIIETDYGNAFPIIILSVTLDTTKYNCHSPVDTVVYEYDTQNSKGDVVVVVYPDGQDYAPAYVTCNAHDSSGPTDTLTLYSGASSLQTLGAFVVVVLAALFF